MFLTSHTADLKVQGHCQRKRKNRFSRVSSSKMDQFTSNQEQNTNTFHQRKWSVFVILSVSTVICNIPFVHSILERSRKFVFFGEVTPYSSEWWCNSKIKRWKVNVTENENVKISFSRISSSQVDRFTSNQDQKWAVAHSTHNYLLEYV